MQAAMKKQQINSVFISVVFNWVFLSNKREAFPQFKKKLFYFINDAPFQFQFGDRFRNAKKPKVITALEHLIGKSRLQPFAMVS